MKIFALLCISLLSTTSFAAEPLKLNEKYEKVKAAGYSQWSAGEDVALKEFMIMASNLFAAKVSKELGGTLSETQIEVNIPRWAKVADIGMTGYFETKGITPVSNQVNVIYAGKDNVICKMTSKPTFLLFSVAFSADCVQYQGQYRQFSVDGDAKIKGTTDQFLRSFLKREPSIEDFVVTVGKPQQH